MTHSKHLPFDQMLTALQRQRRRKLHRTVLAVLTLSLAGCATTPASNTLPAWLVGCWESSDGRSREAWVRDSDDTLSGFSTTVSEGKVSFHELMSIRRFNDSRLVFTAYPSNQPGGSFPAVSQEDDALVFQNSEHDYPQRIRYRRSGDELQADIALADGANQYDFVKTACSTDAT